jgi:Flp pilus assembly pilin Flp
MKMTAVRAVRSIASLVGRLVRDEGGQDLLEYALLSAFVGLAGITAFNAMGMSIEALLRTSNSNVNNRWYSGDPGLGGS